MAVAPKSSRFAILEELPIHDVNCTAQGRRAGLHQRFAEGRVRMNRQRQIFGGSGHFEGQGGLANEIARRRSDDVDPEHSAAAALRYHLHKSVRLTDAHGATQSSEWEFAEGNIDAF